MSIDYAALLVAASPTPSFAPANAPLAAARPTPPLTAAAVLPPLPAPAGGGSRRRRLWELTGHAHCPVIGVCLPLPALRRLLARLDGTQVIDDDYELHCTMVSLAKRRGPMAEALQRELDRRYLRPLREVARVKDEAALRRWWDEASAGNDLGAALWTTLTHPQCSAALRDRVLGQVHMHQHQVGMVTRVELARFEQLIDENAVLARTLAQAQQRSTQQSAECARQREQFEAERLQCRAEAIASRSERDQLQAQLAELRAADPERGTRAQLAAERRELQERLLQAQRALQRAQQELAAEKARAQVLARDLAETQAQLCEVRTAALAPKACAAHAPQAAPRLNARAVLCVGGRLASVPIYRHVVERVGGRFLHHDGGDEDSPQRLDATLAAADLVICQTGCISHGAYWRVKEHCKRTGKRCLFVEVPSRQAIEQALSRALLEGAQA